MSRALALVLAGVALALAAVLAALAVDSLRWQERLRAGDVHFKAVPGSAETWDAPEIVPGVAHRVLGVDDDIDYRRAVRVFEIGQPRWTRAQHEKLLSYRALAQQQLTELALREHDRKRRSRVINLLGALGLSRVAARPVPSAVELRETAALFEQAVELDPQNADAKANLELTLRVLSGRRPGRAGREGRRQARRKASRVGVTQAGTGY